MTLTEEHQKYALQFLESIRADLLFDYVSKFKLTDIVGSDCFLDLAQKHFDNHRYGDCTSIIARFEFFDKFDLKHIINNLVDVNNFASAKMLVMKDREL